MELSEAEDLIQTLTRNEDIIVTPTSDPDTIRLRWGRGDAKKVDLDRKQAEAVATVANSAYSQSSEDNAFIEEMSD